MGFTVDAFRVGQLVRVRSWESMEREYGVDEYGNIPCKHVFIKEMRQHCGKTLTISEIDYNANCFKFDSIIYDYISSDMIEPATIYPEIPSINIGDVVEAVTNKKGNIFAGEKYEVIALAKYKNGVYIRSETVTDYDGKNCEIPIQQPYSFLTFKELKIVSFGGQL